MISLGLIQEYIPIWLFVDLAIVSELMRINDTMAIHVIPSESLDISAISYLGLTLFNSDIEDTVLTISGINQNHMIKISTGRRREFIRNTNLNQLYSWGYSPGFANLSSKYDVTGITLIMDINIENDHLISIHSNGEYIAIFWESAPKLKDDIHSVKILAEVKDQNMAHKATKITVDLIIE